jgi:hypothetical protein
VPSEGQPDRGPVVIKTCGTGCSRPCAWQSSVVKDASTRSPSAATVGVRSAEGKRVGMGANTTEGDSQVS